MEKKKIDKVIEAFRHYINLKEEMMTTQSSAGKPGFSEKSPPEGATAGMTPGLTFDGRSKIARRLPPLYRKDILKRNKKK
jgi:hypothetical protein